MFASSVTTVGLQLDLLVFGSVTLALLLTSGTLYVAIRRSRNASRQSNLRLAARFSGCLGLVEMLVVVALLVPFSTQYYQMYRVTGLVQSVSDVPYSGILTQTPVIRLDTVDRPVVVDDPRIVALEGRQVTFTCEVRWHYEAADTISCKIFSIGQAH